MAIENINIKNKKASFEYHFLEQYTAGIVLTGTEIKSVREGRINITDAFCLFLNHELWVKNMHIPEYKFGTHYNHEPKRARKLLLNKREMVKLETKLKEKGLTIVVTRLFLTDKGLAQLDIALAKGKKLYDKREDLKQKDAKRELRDF